MVSGPGVSQCSWKTASAQHGRGYRAGVPIGGARQNHSGIILQEPEPPTLSPAFAPGLGAREVLESSTVTLMCMLSADHCGRGRGDADFLDAPMLGGLDSNQCRIMITQGLSLQALQVGARATMNPRFLDHGDRAELGWLLVWSTVSQEGHDVGRCSQVLGCLSFSILTQGQDWLGGI